MAIVSGWSGAALFFSLFGEWVESPFVHVEAPLLDPCLHLAGSVPIPPFCNIRAISRAPFLFRIFWHRLCNMQSSCHPSMYRATVIFAGFWVLGGCVRVKIEAAPVVPGQLKVWCIDCRSVLLAYVVGLPDHASNSFV